MAAAPTATPDSADEVAAKAVASVLGKTKTPPAASSTGLTLTVAATDRKSLSKPQTSALNRAQTILAGLFDVSVSYGEESGEQPSDDEPTQP